MKTLAMSQQWSIRLCGFEKLRDESARFRVGHRLVLIPSETPLGESPRIAGDGFCKRCDTPLRSDIGRYVCRPSGIESRSPSGTPHTLMMVRRDPYDMPPVAIESRKHGNSFHIRAEQRRPVIGSRCTVAVPRGGVLRRLIALLHCL